MNKMIDFMDNHSEAGILGCKLLDSHGALQRSCRSFPTLLTEFWRSTSLDILFPKNRIFGRYYMTYWNHDDIREVDQPMGACLMVRRKAMEEVGLLDEQFYMYFEEVDWCYRIKKAGWKIYFTPEAQVIHHGKQSTGQARMDMLVERYKSLYKFFRKHYGRISVYILRAILGVGFLREIFSTFLRKY